MCQKPIDRRFRRIPDRSISTGRRRLANPFTVTEKPLNRFTPVPYTLSSVARSLANYTSIAHDRGGISTPNRAVPPVVETDEFDSAFRTLSRTRDGCLQYYWSAPFLSVSILMLIDRRSPAAVVLRYRSRTVDSRDRIPRLESIPVVRERISLASLQQPLFMAADRSTVSIERCAWIGSFVVESRRTTNQMPSFDQVSDKGNPPPDCMGVLDTS